MVKNKKLHSKKLYLLLTLLAIALILGGYLLVNAKRDHSPSTNPISSASKSGDINYNPPTNSEISDTEKHKEDLANNPTPPTGNTSDGKKTVTPIISYADKSTINAYVTGIFEEGGVCTATLTKGTRVITKTSTGFQNASYTQCAPIDLSGGSVDSGDWSIVVSYSSKTASGKSETLVKKL